MLVVILVTIVLVTPAIASRIHTAAPKPRAGAADSALAGDLAVLRNAIDLYATEHVGAFPTEADIANQLTQYTDAAGDAQAARDATHIYGPYLRKVPPVPVGARKGGTGIAAADAAGVGWIYTAATGDIHANTTTEADAAGTLYKDY